MKKIILYLNLWRFIVPSILCFIDKIQYENVKKDLKKLEYAIPDIEKIIGLWWALLYNIPYRAVFQYRMRNHKVLNEIVKITLPNKREIEISGNIEGGVVIYHGQCCVIHCNRAGENLSVFQGVTIGRNPSHILEESDKPIIGNNVTLYTGCVVAGGITIGNNVRIAAGTVVLENVPDNCTVAGNPAKIISSYNTTMDGENDGN